MSPAVNSETVIVISSDDDFECCYVDLKRPVAKRRKHQRQLKESSVKKRRVNLEPKAEPVLLWKNEQQKPDIVSDDDLHKESYYQKSYEAMLQQRAPDVLPRLWGRDYSLTSNTMRVWESDKQMLDIRRSSVASDYASNNKNVKRETSKKWTVKPLSYNVPKEELAELELNKTIQKKRLSCADQNSRRLLSNSDTKSLLIPPCDLRSNKNFCPARLKVQSYSQSRKAGEKTESLTDLNLFIDSLKFKQRQFNMRRTSNNSEKSDYSVDSCNVQSKQSRKTNIRSEMQELKDDFTNQNDFQRTDCFSRCDNFSSDDNFQNRANFVSEDILECSDEEISLKRKPLLIDKYSEVSSGDELETELPDLETTENRSSNEPLQILTSTKNVDKLECISLIPVPALVPVKTEPEMLCTEVGYGTMANDSCHLYLEFPPFLSEPSSNSWLKHCNGDCKSTKSSDWAKVSEFSAFKVAFIKELFDEFEVNTQSASSRKKSKQVPLCDEEVCFAGTSCHLVSLVFRNMTSFKSQPTVTLTATLLKFLSYSRTLGDSHSLHRALKGAACLHPQRNALPFNSEMLFEVLESVSEVDKNQQHSRNILSLDFMICCLEMEFLVNFQTISLRRMQKTQLFKLFNSDIALRNIQRQLFVACQRYDPKDRDLIRILPLLQRLLGITGAVVIAGDDGVAQVASMLIDEYEACRQWSVRVALLESVSFPFHRFAMVRQLLERWRSVSMSRSLRSLMVTNVGALLDVYLSDRFLSMLVMDTGRISTEMAEELVMLLYTLVESYLHMKKDFLSSSYWEKIELSYNMENDHDLSSLSLLPGYVDLLRSFLVHHLTPKEKLSRKTCLYLVKLECLADLCIQQ